ncbi:hypothetical protein BDR22DRAFT_823540 [Usnea florida]
MDHADCSLNQQNIKSHQPQRDSHKKIHRETAAISRIPVRRHTKPESGRPVLHETHNIQPNHHQTRKDSSHQTFSIVPISGLTHLSTCLPPSLPDHNACQHRELQHQGSQHNQHDFNSKSELKPAESSISSHSTSVASNLSNKDSSPKDQLPSIPTSSSLETAHLWDLVRLTVSHLPQKSTSTMTSTHSGSSRLSQFSHQIPKITPTKLSVSTDRVKITTRLSEWQSDNDSCGELDFNKQLDPDYANDIVHHIIKHKASIKNLQYVMKEKFFPLPSSRSRRGLNSTTGKDQSPPHSILSSNEFNLISSQNAWGSLTSQDSPSTYTAKTPQTDADDNNPRSPLPLNHLELALRVDVDFKSIHSATSGPQAQINGKPTNKSNRSKSSMPAPMNTSSIDPVLDFRKASSKAPLTKFSKKSTVDPTSDATTRGRAPSRADNEGSILNHTWDSSIVRFPLELADTSSISFGLENSALREKFPRGYLKYLSTFLVDDQMCVEFFRVIFTVRDQVQTLRRLLIAHAQATILDYASVERADKGEDKMQTLQNIYYMGCIVYDTYIEFWEVKYTPGQQQCGNFQSSTSFPNPGGQNHPTSRSLSPFPQCEVHALGSLDVSLTTNVELCREFLSHIMRWGLTKYCKGYIDNLHRVSWSSERWPSMPEKMNPEETNTYWNI